MIKFVTFERSLGNIFLFVFKRNTCSSSCSGITIGTERWSKRSNKFPRIREPKQRRKKNKQDNDTGVKSLVMRDNVKRKAPLE
jgi:hypothetical protein